MVKCKNIKNVVKNKDTEYRVSVLNNTKCGRADSLYKCPGVNANAEKCPKNNNKMNE